MEALGFDLKYFLFQLFNFGLLFFILRTLLHKPLTAMLDKRRDDIASGLENAEKMKQALSEAEEQQRQLLEDTRKEARELMEASKKQAKALEQELQEEAAAKAAELLLKNQEELNQQRETFEKQLRAEMAELVIKATEKVLDTTISSKEKQEHIEKITKEIA